jgi:hypothetical protein
LRILALAHVFVAARLLIGAHVVIAIGLLFAPAAGGVAQFVGFAIVVIATTSIFTPALGHARAVVACFAFAESLLFIALLPLGAGVTAGFTFGVAVTFECVLVASLIQIAVVGPRAVSLQFAPPQRSITHLASYACNVVHALRTRQTPGSITVFAGPTIDVCVARESLALARRAIASFTAATRAVVLAICNGLTPKTYCAYLATMALPVGATTEVGAHTAVVLAVVTGATSLVGAAIASTHTVE